MMDRTLKCQVAYNDYGGYCIPDSSSDRPAAVAVLSGRVYEPKTIEYMRQNCGEGDILHAGTFFGDFIPGLSGAVNEKSKILAFEPNLESYHCAMITLEFNLIQNVILNHAGLGEKKGVLEFKSIAEDGTSLGGGSRFVREGSSGHANTDEVAVFTIDEIMD